MRKGEETSYSPNSCSSNRIQWNGLILTGRGLYGSCGSRYSRFTEWPSLCSLLFCYYSLLVFVKIARFGYRHYYKSFFTVCTYKLVPSALPALRLCGTRELRHWWPNDSKKQNLGLFSLSLFGLCGGLLRHFSIAASNSQRLSFMSDGHEVSLMKGLRETSSPFQSFAVINWPSS